MELRDALRMLRSEIGLTQTELAEAVNVGFTAANRWENKNTRPNKAASVALLALAEKRRVSAECLDALTTLLLSPRVKDGADRQKLAEVTEQLKLEERVLLTNAQMKTTIDNLDLAIIVQRIRSARPEGVQVIYQNRRYAEIFGYTEAEFAKKARENIYFCISKESRDDYLRRIKRLIGGALPLAKFGFTLQAIKKGGATIWLELKGINLTHYSYGYELCLSCRDVTPRVEAERKYAEEVAVRDASLQGFYASFHCDLTANTVLRSRDMQRVVGREVGGGSVDGILCEIAGAIAGTPYRARFLQVFDRGRLLAAYDEKNTFGSVRAFHTLARRWLRSDYVLIQNPYSSHLEAAIYLYDIQQQTLAEKMMTAISDHFFEYIGLIDAELGAFEAYYYAQGVFRSEVLGKRDYAAICEEKLRAFALKEEYEAQRNAVRLETIQHMLSEKSYYSTTLHIRNYDGAMLYKKVTYTYLDDTHTMIVMAQSDIVALSRLVQASSAGSPSGAAGE